MCPKQILNYSGSHLMLSFNLQAQSDRNQLSVKKTSYPQKPHWLVFAFCLFIVIRLVKVIILSYIHYAYIGGISSISIIQRLTHLQTSGTLLKIM
jgi:hypothetical protein